MFSWRNDISVYMYVHIYVCVHMVGADSHHGSCRVAAEGFV